MGPESAWRFIAAGLVLVSMALSSSVLKRLPLTTAILYLACGFGFSVAGLGVLRLELEAHARILEHLTEGAVLVSLFTAGLKLRAPFGNRRWWLALRLATLSMLVTVALLTALGVVVLGLPLGAAVLLGAILAPTDPVLASDVQVTHPQDQDRVRFALTGEAGLNDGTAFPFVYLGLGLLGLREIGPFGSTWFLLDVVWGSVGGIAIGAALGTGVARLVVFLRRRHKEAVGLDDFLALGLIAGAYGVALLVHASGFLAVFAAGAAVRRMERNDAGDHPGPAIPLAAQSHIATPEHALHVATAEETATAYMAQAVLAFNEQVERIGEVAAVIVLGGLLSSSSVFSLEALLLGVTLFFVVRPVAVATGLARAAVTRTQARLIAWFGVRGIGSLYYLAYAVTHGLPPELVDRIGGLVLCVVALSVIVHGVSVTPAMSWYGRRRAQPA